MVKERATLLAPALIVQKGTAISFAHLGVTDVDLIALRVCYVWMDSDTQKLIEILHDQFDAQAAQDMHAVVNFATTSEDAFLSICIDQTSLQILECPSSEPDLTLIADCTDTFHRIFAGQQHPVGAFMQGEFRSDGYLILVFQVLSVFLSLRG